VRLELLTSDQRYVSHPQQGLDLEVFLAKGFRRGVVCFIATAIASSDPSDLVQNLVFVGILWTNRDDQDASHGELVGQDLGKRLGRRTDVDRVKRRVLGESLPPVSQGNIDHPLCQEIPVLALEIRSCPIDQVLADVDPKDLAAPAFVVLVLVVAVVLVAAAARNVFGWQHPPSETRREVSGPASHVQDGCELLLRYRRVDLLQGVGVHVRGADRLSQPDAQGAVGVTKVVGFGFGFEQGTVEAIIPPVDEFHDFLDGVRPNDLCGSELFDQLALVRSLALPGIPHVGLVLKSSDNDNGLLDDTRNKEKNDCDIPAAAAAMEG